jgi:hypothetical protein
MTDGSGSGRCHCGRADRRRSTAEGHDLGIVVHEAGVAMGWRPERWGREPAMVLALVQAVIALVVAFGLNLARDQIGAILAVTAVILGLITRSRVSPAATRAPGSERP